MERKEDLIKNKQSLNRKSFIYFLIKDDEIVYVGQTINGMARIHAHYGKKDFDYYTYIECAPEGLDELENDYILEFMPKYNKMINLSGQYLSRNMVREKGIDGHLFNRLKKIYKLKSKKVYKIEYYNRNSVMDALGDYRQKGNVAKRNGKYYIA